MPELPEVETVRHALESFIGYETKLINGEITRPNLRFAFPENFIARMQQTKITKFDRHGKYLLLHLSNDLIWLIHLGMSGQIRLNRNIADPKTRHHHVNLIFSNKKYLSFYDPRRFGFMDLFPTNQWAQNRFLAKLGFDPITTPNNMATALLTKARGCQTHMKGFLLNQSNIAGIGNIYCSETLWLAKIHPERPAKSLSKKEWQNVSQAINEILRKAIKAGGSSFSDFSHPDGTLGYFQNQWHAYGKAGEACQRCQKSPIKRIIQNNRASFFCSHCTPEI